MTIKKRLKNIPLKDYDPVDLHCPICKAKHGGESVDGHRSTGLHTGSGTIQITYRCDGCHSIWTERWKGIDGKPALQTVVLDKVRPKPDKKSKKVVEKVKSACLKCGEMEVVMTWRPTMVGTMSLIEECEECHFRPKPRSEAWGYKGGAVPVHYGDPPHTEGLENLRIKCNKCDGVLCKFHDTYWECPKCSTRAAVEDVLESIKKKAGD